MGFHLQHGEVGYSTETAEALANDAPFPLFLGIICREASTHSFAVSYDIVCPEILQIFGLLDGIALQGQGACCDG